jgi:uncharacterized membrane protein
MRGVRGRRLADLSPRRVRLQRITGGTNMAPFSVLVVSLLVFRGLGVLGAGAFAAWQDDACYALALLFLFTASAHCTKTREDLIAMVPPHLPFPRALVTFTGVCEILGAIGLVIPATRGLAGIALVLLLLALLPANINASFPAAHPAARPGADAIVAAGAHAARLHRTDSVGQPCMTWTDEESEANGCRLGRCR